MLDLNTDCVSAAFPKDILPFTTTDININDYYYDDAKTLPKYKLENKETRLEAPKLAKYKRTIQYEHIPQKWTEYNDVTDNDFTPLVNQIIE